MTCSKCTTTPTYDYMNVKAYISTSADHLNIRIGQSLSILKYHYQALETYWIAEVPNFELLIEELMEGEFFNALEMKEIHILPFESGKIMDFGLFLKTKSLAYWVALIQHKDLLYVLDQNRLVTHFQPIVTADSHEVFGYEALTRGLKADGRLLSPKEMFSGAKDLDLLFNLDRQCRETGLKNAAEQQIHNHIFLNFVPTSIYDPSECLKTTVKAAQDYKLDPSKIVFEVVESEFIDDFSHLKVVLDYYKNQGYQTALDDLGSGFSTIEAFHSLNTEFIKIDMAIIRNIHHNLANQSLFERIMQLKALYGVTIIAEGVEKEEEYHYLKHHGVDLIQGYYFGKPQLKITV